MNLQEELKALKERIAELENQAKEEQEFPQDGDGYWYIDDYGYILNEKWDGLDFEEFRLAVGNVFKTKDQAEFAVEKLKVEAELLKFSKSPNMSAVKWFIVCADSEEVYTLYTTQEISQGTIYFESKKVAQQAIETVGIDRIKKYIFGVED